MATLFLVYIVPNDKPASAVVLHRCDLLSREAMNESTVTERLWPTGGLITMVQGYLDNNMKYLAPDKNYTDPAFSC